MLTYNETGYTDFSGLFDEYETAYGKAAAKAGRYLVQNLQDQTMRAGLSLAGWNPKHDDMKRQTVEWWEWGEFSRLTVTIRVLDTETGDVGNSICIY